METEKRSLEISISIFQNIIGLGLIFLTKFIGKIPTHHLFYKIFYQDWPEVGFIENIEVVPYNYIDTKLYFMFLILLITYFMISFLRSVTASSNFFISEIIFNFIIFFTSIIDIYYMNYKFNKLTTEFLILLSLMITLFLFTFTAITFRLIFKKTKVPRIELLDIPDNSRFFKPYFFYILLVLPNILLALIIIPQNEFIGRDALYHFALIESILNGNNPFSHPLFINELNYYPVGFHYLIIIISKITGINPMTVFNYRWLLLSLVSAPVLFKFLTNIDINPTVAYFIALGGSSWYGPFGLAGGGVSIGFSMSLGLLSFMFLIKFNKENSKINLILAGVFHIFAILFHYELGFYFTVAFLIFLIVRFVMVRKLIESVVSFIAIAIFSLIAVSPVLSCDDQSSKQDNKQDNKVFLIILILIAIFSYYLGNHGFNLEGYLIIGINAPLSIFSFILIPLTFFALRSELPSLKSKDFQVLIPLFVAYSYGVIRILISAVFTVLDLNSGNFYTIA